MATTQEENAIFKLGRLISDNLSVLDKASTLGGLTLPDLNTVDGSSKESFRSDPLAAQAAKVIASACLQLAASLMPANDYTFSVAAGDYRSSALRVCLEANVTEILREAGPEGLHVKEISKRCNLEPNKLGRLLRYLATYHIYREVSPDVFTNNRNSAILDSGKPTNSIQESPESKYDLTALPALCSHSLDILSKCGAGLWDAMSDPETTCAYCHPALTAKARPIATAGSHVRHRTSAHPRTAFNHGLKTDLSFWEYLDLPENRSKRNRFGFAMKGMAAIQPKDAIFKAFDWEGLPRDSLVVDVGGGIGIPVMSLADRFKDVRFVIQDLPNVVQAGKKMWEIERPEVLGSGRVQFEVHDFRQAQPPRVSKTPVSVFLLKNVLHNWGTAEIIKVLSHLRRASTPSTQLVIIDGVLPYACRTKATGSEDEYHDQEAPEPLLPNYGPLVDQFYWLDLTMMYLFDGQEPTVRVLHDVLEASGWKLVTLGSVDPEHNFVQSVVAVPA